MINDRFYLPSLFYDISVNLLILKKPLVKQSIAMNRRTDFIMFQHSKLFLRIEKRYPRLQQTKLTDNYDK